MTKVLTAMIGIGGVAVVSRSTAAGLVVVVGIVALLVLIARLTASPLAVTCTRHDTWFDRPDGDVVFRGARPATTRQP